jgi:hypothetical protein
MEQRVDGALQAVYLHARAGFLIFVLQREQEMVLCTCGLSDTPMLGSNDVACGYELTLFVDRNDWHAPAEVCGSQPTDSQLIGEWPLRSLYNVAMLLRINDMPAAPTLVVPHMVTERRDDRSILAQCDKDAFVFMPLPDNIVSDDDDDDNDSNNNDDGSSFVGTIPAVAGAARRSPLAQPRVSPITVSSLILLTAKESALEEEDREQFLEKVLFRLNAVADVKRTSLV